MAGKRMRTPLVSVVVPTYNQAEHVGACLDALWFQEYEPLEIVVVNDGATDDTARVLADYARGLAGDTASYAARYDPDTDAIARVTHARYPARGRAITFLSHGRNRGLAAALNTGIAASTGRYCTYVPSDDLCFPHMIGTLVGALEEGGADFAYADMFVHDAGGRILRRFSLPDYSFARCFEDWYLCGVAKLYRRELHDRFGLYDEALLAHDHALFQRFALGGAAFVHVPKVLMTLLAHEGDRERDIHSTDNWNRLLRESRALVLEARRAAATRGRS